MCRLLAVKLLDTQQTNPIHEYISTMYLSGNELKNKQQSSQVNMSPLTSFDFTTNDERSLSLSSGVALDWAAST